MTRRRIVVDGVSYLCLLRSWLFVLILVFLRNKAQAEDNVSTELLLLRIIQDLPAPAPAPFPVTGTTLSPIIAANPSATPVPTAGETCNVCGNDTDSSVSDPTTFMNFLGAVIPCGEFEQAVATISVPQIFCTAAQDAVAQLCTCLTTPTPVCQRLNQACTTSQECCGFPTNTARCSASVCTRILPRAKDDQDDVTLSSGRQLGGIGAITTSRGNTRRLLKGTK